MRCWWLVLAAASAPGAARAQTQAVIFPDGRVYVRLTIERPLPRGPSVIPLALEGSLAGAVIALDSGVTVISQRAPLKNDPGMLLRRAVGHRVVFRSSPPLDTVSAMVLSADPPRFQLADGSIAQSLPGTMLVPEEVGGPARLASITVESRAARPRLTVGYLTTGAWWQGQYTLTFEDGRARLSGSAVIVSEGVALDSVEVMLLEGRVFRASMTLTGTPGDPGARTIQTGLVNLPSASSADSLRLFPVAGRHTIRPYEVTFLPFFAEMRVEASRVITLPGVLPAQPIGSPSGRTAVPVVATVRYRIARIPRSPLAGALPGGIARIFSPLGGAGRMLAAEAVVAPADSGAPLELVAGPSSEVVATRTLFESSPVVDTTISATGSRTVRTVATLFDHAMRLQNRTDSTIVIEIVERREEPWSVVASSVPAEPLAPGAVRFRITLRPRAEQTFTARMRVPVS